MTKQEAFEEFFNKTDWSFSNRINWPTIEDAFMAGFKAGFDAEWEGWEDKQENNNALPTTN